jgi:hypothetical protein
MVFNSADMLQNLWSRQRAWSKAADRAKADVARHRLASLLLVVLAAGLGAAAPELGRVDDHAGRICGLVAGVSLGLIPLVRSRLDVSTYEAWSRLRSVSEALKVEIYTYLAGVDPYRDEDRGAKLMQRGTDVLRKGDDLLDRIRTSDQRERPLPAVTDVPTYIDQRVRRQARTYYEPQARQMGRRARRVRVAQTVLSLAAVGLGVLASTNDTGLAPWIGVIGTISGAVIAHSAAARYSFLQLEYQRTAAELDRILERYEHSHPTGPVLDDWLVATCEAVISFQNEAWMAELVTPRRDDSDASIPPPV